MNTKKNLRDDERAVSPVVGVILMVAITVIMAAVIGAFVYGYGGSMTASATPAFMVSRASDTGITITLTDMGGAGNVTGLDIQSPTAATAMTNTAWTVGTTSTYTDAAIPTGTVIVMNATVDGENRVVYNMRI